MHAQPEILFLLSAATVLRLRDGTEIPSGFWAEEFVVPWEILQRTGWSLGIATPSGQLPQVDPQSLYPENLGDDLQKVQRLRQQLTHIEALQQPLNLRDLLQTDLSTLRGVFIPGGNGPLMDLPHSVEVAQLLRHCRNTQVALATLCHGSAALLATDLRDAPAPYTGQQITCFSAREEAATALAGNWPYTLELELKKAGFRVRVGEPWHRCVVSDERILSGQNPASAPALTQAFIQRIISSQHKGLKQ